MAIEAESRREGHVNGKMMSDNNTAPLSLDMASDLAKKIRIQTGVTTRLMKDYSFYISESKTILEQIEKLKADKVCVHDIKQRAEVYAETRSMAPHVLNQVRAARDKLCSLIAEADITDESETIPLVVQEARVQIQRANDVLHDVPTATRVGSDDESDESSATEY